MRLRETVQHGWGTRFARLRCGLSDFLGSLCALQSQRRSVGPQELQCCPCNADCTVVVRGSTPESWCFMQLCGPPPLSPLPKASLPCDMCLSRRVLDAATGSFHVRSRRVLVHMATSAYRRAALKELHAMKGSRAHEHAAVGARLQRLCMLCHANEKISFSERCLSRRATAIYQS